MKFPFLNMYVLVALSAAAACGSDTEADSLGVGAECSVQDDCDQETNQQCLTSFKGGYCGIEGCVSDADCPSASACVTHDDSINYCFRTCTDKAECNENRSPEQESNCSGSVTFVETQQDVTKACIPPSGA
jgi:hypothetical protein